MNLLSQRHSQRLPRLRIERTEILDKVVFHKYPGMAHLGAGHDAGPDLLTQGLGMDPQQCCRFRQAESSHWQASSQRSADKTSGRRQESC